MADPQELPFDHTLLDEALEMTPSERVHLQERLWREYLKLHPDQPRGFFVQFDSFQEYERWRSERDRPWLY